MTKNFGAMVILLTFPSRYNDYRETVAAVRRKRLLRVTVCGAKIVPLAAFVAISSVSARELPSGRIVEVHSVEVYTGGCTASAQATMGGRSMLRVWSFEDGAQDGVELKGLQIAASQVADKNLVFADTQPTSAVVYLPQKATDAQRAALVSWLKVANPEIASAPMVEKIAEIKYEQKDATRELGG